MDVFNGDKTVHTNISLDQKIDAVKRSIKLDQNNGNTMATPLTCPPVGERFRIS